MIGVLAQSEYVGPRLRDHEPDDVAEDNHEALIMRDFRHFRCSPCNETVISARTRIRATRAHDLRLE